MGRGKRITGAAVAALVVVTGYGCDRPGGEPAEFAPAIAFDTAAVLVETETDTFRLSVELAETPEQKAYGLMERPHLPEEHGMLFLYAEPQPAGSGFWMFRTRIPLDIAFLDDEGRIVAILAMEPCESPNPAVCRTYSPGVPYSAALEVNRGYFERRGVEVGDRVVRLNGEGG